MRAIFLPSHNPGNQYSAVISSYLAVYSTRRHRNVKGKKKHLMFKEPMTAARLSDQRITDARAGSQMGLLNIQVWYVTVGLLGRQSFFSLCGTKDQTKNQKMHHRVRGFRVMTLMTSMTGTRMPVLYGGAFNVSQRFPTSDTCHPCGSDEQN